MSGLPTFVIPLGLILFAAFLLRIFYSLSFSDSFLWCIGVFIFFYIPGNLLVRFSDFKNDEFLSKLFHSIALGTALVPLIYLWMRRFSLPQLMFPFGILLFLSWLVIFLRDIKKGEIRIYTTSRDILAIIVLIAVIFVLLHLSHFTDIVLLENGFKIRTTYLSETIFHLGLINVLKYTFPPFYPYAAGYDFSHYHLNMHLEIEMFNRFFSVDTIKLAFFYFPLLYFFLGAFVPYMFIRRREGSRFFAVFSGMLIFCSDFSFVP